MVLQCVLSHLPEQCEASAFTQWDCRGSVGEKSLKVTNLRNGKEMVVRINDRGPFSGDRVIDIAHGAAQHLGLVSSGIAQVRLEVLR